MCVTRHKSKNFYCSAMDAHVRHVHKIPEEVKFYILTHFSIKINLFWSIIYSKITMALANTTKYLAAVNVLKFTSITFLRSLVEMKKDMTGVHTSVHFEIGSHAKNG